MAPKSARIGASRSAALVCSLVLVIALGFGTLSQPTVNGGSLTGQFVTYVVTDGLFQPTTFAFAPDGRVFIGQKNGVIRVFKNGQLLPTPLVSIPNVNTYQDRGLLSIAVDPDFETNGYLYIAYTHDVNPADFTGPKTARLIRLTVVGDTASMATKQIVLGSVVGDAANPSCDDFPLGADCIPSDGRTHTIGGMQFLSDGTLLVTTGEGAPDEQANAQALRAQQLDSLGGKMLRITPDGAGLPSNPFYNGDPDANRSKVYAFGFRNPFRFGLQPGTEVPFAGDVGWGGFEEINVVVPGGNYGWPCYEGTEFLLAFGVYQMCTDLQAAGTAIEPLYAYPTLPGAAVVAGAFYDGVEYPPAYQGAFFFGDFVWSRISTLRVDANNELVPGSVVQFTDQADGPVQISSGPGDDIFYLSLLDGELRRIEAFFSDPSGDADGDTIANDSDPDDDNDGCTDVKEIGAQAAFGGRRDPEYFWDFFDTPTNAGARDTIISTGDVQRIVQRFGTTGSIGIDPLSPPAPTGYHTAFDRTPPLSGEDVWDLNGPDGSVSVSDILLGVRQFGHTCA